MSQVSVIRWFFKFVICVFVMVQAAVAFALPPEIEADRLLMAAEQELSQSDFESARQYLERIKALGVELPVEFYRLYGEVLYQAEELDLAQQNLEKYVTLINKDNEHYKPVLSRLTDIEKALTIQTKRQKVKEENIAISTGRHEHIKLLENQKGEAYDQKVQQLYLGMSLKEALLTHLNSLLKSYVYMKGKIKNPQRSDRIEYTLSLSGDSNLVVTQRDIKHGAGGLKSSISVTHLNVFGVNPVFDFRCSKVADSCLIKHPVTGKDWLRLADDETGAKEISLALSRLVKAMQRQ